MIQRLRKLLSKDISVLVGAGMVAQAANLAAYPLLTHFYSPADFGLFSIIIAMATFVGIALLLRIETLYQIVGAEEEEDHLIAAITAALLLTLAVFAVALLFGPLLISVVITDSDQVNWHWNYSILIALLAFLSGVFSLAREYNAKNGRYGRLALAQILRAVLAVGSQLGLVLLWKNAGADGLIAGFTVGLGAATLLAWPLRTELMAILWTDPTRAWATTRRIVHKYGAYIRVDVVNVLIRRSFVAAYPIFVLMSFGVTETGIYAVASRVSFIPIDVIASAISTVYFQRFAMAVRADDHTLRLFLTTLAGGLIIALGIAAALALLAVPLVDLIFGDDWTRTAVIILYLLPTFLARFSIACIGSTPLALKRPDLLLHWNLAQLAIIAIALWYTYDDTLESFLLYSGIALLAASALYAGMLFVTIAKRHTQKAA